MYNGAVNDRFTVQVTTKVVILSGVRSAESKDLRTEYLLSRIDRA